MNRGGQQAPASDAAGRFRWFVCALLFFATTINYVDRQILSLVKEMLDAEIGWSATEFGLVNSAFQGAYALSLLFFGWFVDRHGARSGYALSIGVWSALAMAHAFASSFGSFLVARIGLGLGEGGNFPSAIKVVTRWFPVHERAFATSIFNAGSNVGAILAPAVVPLIAFTWGWQAAFVLAGAAGIVWLFAWLPFYDDPARSRRLGAAERAYIAGGQPVDEAAAAGESWLALLRMRKTWAFLIAKFLTDPVWWFFLIWLPDFFLKTHDLAIRKSWDKLVAIYAIVTVLSIVGGWMTGFLTTRGWSVTRARKSGLLLFALCVLPVVFATSVDVWPAVLLIALAGSAHQAWSANLFTTVSDMFPQRSVASVIGLGSCAGAIGGMLFPVYCGHMLDVWKARGNEAMAYTELLQFCAFAYVVAFVLHHLLAPRFDSGD